MSSTIDPAKLKVVELRNELQERGLDNKGNKAVLVQRLKEALEKETNTSLPDTSILETTTEDLDVSQNEDSQDPSTKEVKEADVKMEVDSCPKPQTTTKTPEKSTTPATTKTPEKAKSKESPTKPQESKPTEAKKEVAENGEQAESSDKEAVSTTASDSKETTDSKESAKKVGEESATTEQKGEKRKRDGDSPDREGAQKVRAKSPIKEDEPAINNDNVQLNWYDSDLHLQVDKENFLSAKPFTEGAFGYAWAGVRASHGVSKGKVCYEVKIIDEIKWEDLTKITERHRQDIKRNQKRDRDKRGRKSDDKKSDKPAEDKEKVEEKPEEKKESTENGNKENAEAISKDSTENKESETVNHENEKEEKMDTAAAGETTNEEETPMETESAPSTDETKKSEDATEQKDDETKKGEQKEDEKKKVEEKEEKKEPEEDLPIHLVRVGWSLMTSSLQLGEDKCSYAYESTGKFVNDKQFIDYGKAFAVGDVVGAFLNIDDEYVTIRYTVNGEIQPVAATLQKSEFPEDFTLFPHILTRNCAFEINLGQKEEPWFAAPDLLQEYEFLAKIEGKVAGPNRPETRDECEVILMCGLPGSGKTHWVREHIGSNADKRYTVIGNSSLLERMTVAGNSLRSKFKGKWSIFVDRLQKCLNALITLASQRRRNYIIDQTNVFPSAQRRKMRPFEGFKRKAVIIVVGDEEQSKRLALQESTDGKGVPESVILEMKAAMSLPQKGDWMDEVIFAGLNEEETKEQVKKYNEAGKAAGYGTEKRFRFKGVRYNPRKNSFRGGKGDRDRNFRDRRFESRGGSKWGPRGGGGGGWRDRQDRRGPPPHREYRAPARDYGSRDYGRRDSGGYNRSRNLDRVGGGGRWNSGGGGERRSGGGYGGGWNQQSYSNSGYGNWGGNQGGSGGGGQWKYGGGGQGYGGGYGGGSQGGGSWNYYGQYGQNQNWGHK